MLSYCTLVIILWILIATTTYADNTLALKLETKTSSDKFSNNTNTTLILGDDTKLLPSDYTPDQINEIIYRLYQLIQNSNSTEIEYGHDIAVLIDLICSNELYESAVEACDLVTELSIESNDY